jgi:hypothetical protein
MLARSDPRIVGLFSLNVVVEFLSLVSIDGASFYNVALIGKKWGLPYDKAAVRTGTLGTTLVCVGPGLW